VSGFLGTVAAALVGGLILAGLLYLIDLAWRDNPVRRWWGRRRAEAEARLLLSEFRRRAAGNLDHTIAIEKAARRAGVNDPGPAVALLRERELVVGAEAGTKSIHVRLTPKGLRATTIHRP
jgi:hypothetical protein